jgi:hypothetical protein
MRFEHVLWAAAGVSTGTGDAHLGKLSRRPVERPKWCLWHGRWRRCLVKLADTSRKTETESIRNAVGIETLRGHLRDLSDYLEANQAALVNYGARRLRGAPISTAFVERVVNEIVSRRMLSVTS